MLSLLFVATELLTVRAELTTSLDIDHILEPSAKEDCLWWKKKLWWGANGGGYTTIGGDTTIAPDTGFTSYFTSYYTDTITGPPVISYATVGAQPTTIYYDGNPVTSTQYLLSTSIVTA